MSPRMDFQQDNAPSQSLLAFEFELARCRGLHSTFGPVFMLPIKRVPNFPLPPEPRADPLLVSGSLSLVGEPCGLAIPGQSWLFNQSELAVPITADQLERLEQKRAGMEPIFELRLQVIGFANGVPMALSPISYHPITLIIPRDQWLRVLDTMGHGLRRLIELPPAPKGLGDGWDEVTQHFAKSAARLAAGDAGVAMGEARIATERLLEVIGQQLQRPRGEKEHLQPFCDVLVSKLKKQHRPRTDDPSKTLMYTIELLSELFKFASHPPHTAYDGAERYVAELALSLATTLYGYAARRPYDLASSAVPIDAEA
jgi:hypothetical protein